MNGEAAERWLARGIELVRVGEVSLEALVEHRDWLAGVLDERGGLPPAGMVIDVGRLLAGAHLPSAPLPPVHPELRAALRSYEDQLLGRLCMSPLYTSLVDAFTALAEPLRRRALTAVTERLLDRVGFGRGAPIRPSWVRRLSAERLAGLEVTDSEVESQLRQAYDLLAAGARRASGLLDPTDLFIVQHIAVLGELGQRLAVEQMSAAAIDLGRALPRRILHRKRDRDREPTRLALEDIYPVGGFASMSTSGKMENLVISELAYMDDDAEIDLFDLRYAEGELLYYTRDDSLYHRGRRAIRVALLGDLSRARVKDPGARWQRIVSACGLLSAITNRLVAWLESRALEIHVVFVQPLLEERALVEILLADWIERGVVSIETAGSLAHVASAAETDSELGDSALLVITCDPVLEPPEVAGVDSAALYLDRPAPRLAWAGRQGSGSGESRALAWHDVGIELLDELV